MGATMTALDPPSHDNTCNPHPQETAGRSGGLRKRRIGEINARVRVSYMDGVHTGTFGRREVGEQAGLTKITTRPASTIGPRKSRLSRKVGTASAFGRRDASSVPFPRFRPLQDDPTCAHAGSIVANVGGSARLR